MVLTQNHKLQYRQSVLEKEITAMHEAFDSALGVLRREKLNLEADVKAAEIKRLTYQQELQLLKVLPFICVPVLALQSVGQSIDILLIPGVSHYRVD